MKSTNQLHSGHRQRMFDKLESNGDQAFTDHEILEMALFFAFSRRNTNEIAHSLLDKFGSLSEVLHADPIRLKEIYGVGDGTANYIRVLSALFRRAENNSVKRERFDTAEVVSDFLNAQLLHVSREMFCAMFLDSSLRLIRYEVLSEGGSASAVACARQIARMAVVENAAAVIIAHNHPGGSALPSTADKSITNTVGSTLSAVGVPLIEHFIVGEEGCLPIMRCSTKPNRIENSKFSGEFFRKFYGENTDT